MIKGSVAGTAGIALLMGGFGTYAVWTDSEKIEASSVKSGTLDVAAGAVAWKDQTDADWTPGPTGDLLVPGDTISRTQTFTFTGTGKNLKGAIDFTPGNKSQTNTDANNAFLVDVAVSGLPEVSGAGGCWEFATSDLPKTVTTTVVYTLKANATNLQNATAGIADSTFAVEQNKTC